MANVGKRIRLLYGPPYGVTIESNEGRGTRIVIRLALKRAPRVDPSPAETPVASTGAEAMEAAGERREQPCG
jgi:hypothetical protein